MEKIALERVSPDRAAAMLAAAGLVDPAGRATPDSIAAAGEAFALTVGDQSGVFVLEKRGARMWVSGAGAVRTVSLVSPGLQAIEAVAIQAGCSFVGFQTGRPGLVEKAKKQGFKVVGFIMEKSV